MKRSKSKQLTPLQIYAKGLDASLDSRGDSEKYQRARLLLNAAPDLYSVLSGLVVALDDLGFDDPDGDVSGTDLVDLINEFLPDMRAAELKARRGAK